MLKDYSSLWDSKKILKSNLNCLAHSIRGTVIRDKIRQNVSQDLREDETKILSNTKEKKSTISMTQWDIILACVHGDVI